MWNIGLFFRCISRQYSNIQQLEFELMDHNISDQRTIHINGPQREKFCNNRVITAKYNIFTFIPKSLWEQFHVYSNCFFLFIVILQQIPGVSPTGRFTTAVPLSFILLVSMVKQFFEDWRLHKADKAVNNSLIYAFRLGAWVKVKWKELSVGDIVKVSEDRMFPADLVLLASSEPEGMCYIRTSNLDGETNLKIRQAPPPKALGPELISPAATSRSATVSSSSAADFDRSNATISANAYAKFIASLRHVRGKIDCEKPTRFLYDFTGSLRIEGAEPYPLNSDQLLLRGSQLKNTKWIIGVCVYTGHETKIMLNVMSPSLKRSSIERLVNRQILALFIILISLCLISAIGNTIYNHMRLDKDWYLGFTPAWWKLSKRGGFFGTKKFRTPTDFPPDFPETNISAQYNYYNNFNNLGDEEMLLANASQERISHYKDKKYSELVATNFGYIFLTFVILYNNLIPISLQVTVEVIRFFQAYFINVDADMYDPDSKMFATARTSSLNEELGLIKYIFSDKTGTLTRNEMEFKKCSLGGKIYGNRKPEDTVYEDPEFAKDLIANDEHGTLLRQFLTVLSVCHTVIPMNKTGKDSTPTIPEPMSPGSDGSGATPAGSPHFDNDQTALSPKGGDEVEINGPGSHRHGKKPKKKLLGFIPTSSKQWLDCCPELAPCFRSTVPSDATMSPQEPDDGPPGSVRSSKSGSQDSGESKSKATKKKIENFQGSSPDECALVEGAKMLGYDFIHRDGPHRVTVNVLGKSMDFDVLNILDFNSDRKRMTIVAKCPPGYLDPPSGPLPPIGTTDTYGLKKPNNGQPITGDPTVVDTSNVNHLDNDPKLRTNSGSQREVDEIPNNSSSIDKNNNQGISGKNSAQDKSNDLSNSRDINGSRTTGNENKSSKGNDDYDLILMCKGADSEVYDRVGNSPECSEFKDVTLKDMETFAIQGLRTLCIAVAPVDKSYYEEWNKEYKEAKLAIKDREKKIDEAFAKIEKDFRLLGSTAIEDKLQEGVPETLTKLAQAGIKTWVLTGDKQETAINIGYSCALLTQDTPLLVVNEDTEYDVKTILKRYRDQLGDRIRKDNRLALIITGKSLKFALSGESQQDFLDVILSCQTIICCRTTPLQKSEVVQLIRRNTNFSTLAVGDGSNDVAMIHAAHVGVGISGREGLQAANSSDFSISQFRFLTKLLLVHGAWNHSRMCKLILYQFYKNICMYIIELWFAIISYFSGQPLFERWTLGLYNVAFTALPPAAIGLFDRTCSAESCLNFPMLYSEAQRAEILDKRVFWIWIFNAIIHSLFIFWFTFVMQMHDVVWKSGKTGDWLVLGNFIYTYVVIVVCLKSGLVTYSWTIMTQIAIWGSILMWMVALVPYSFIWPRIPIAPEMSGEVTLIYSSYVFWFGIIIIPMITLFPDFIIKIFQRTLYPTLIEKVRELEIANQDPTDLITKTTKKTIYWVLTKMFASLAVMDEQEDVKHGKQKGTSFEKRIANLPLSLKTHLRRLILTTGADDSTTIALGAAGLQTATAAVAFKPNDRILNNKNHNNNNKKILTSTGDDTVDKDIEIGQDAEASIDQTINNTNGKGFNKRDIFEFNGGANNNLPPHSKTFDELLLETPIPNKQPSPSGTNGLPPNNNKIKNGNNLDPSLATTTAASPSPSNAPAPGLVSNLQVDTQTPPTNPNVLDKTAVAPAVDVKKCNK